MAPNATKQLPSLQITNPQPPKMFPREHLKNVNAVLPSRLFFNHTSQKTKQQRPYNEIHWENRRSSGLVHSQP